MKLLDCTIKTGFITEEMTVKQAFTECVKYNTPGLPYIDENKKIIGRFSIRNTFYATSIPADLIKHAHLLGNDIEHLEIPEQDACEYINKPANLFLVNQILHLHPDSQIVKALALMEQFDTSYLFVVDDNDQYLGVVTHLSITRLLLENRENQQ